MARTQGSITTIMKLNNSAFKKGLSNSKKDVNKFSGGMKKLGATIGGAFALRSIARFTLESAKLAATMEGVKVAFDRIKPNIAFLDQLKTATAGTVSELDLMRRSVMASNFKIPLDQLASLLKFATKRAQETGESVEYLVNSIVIGIGRKSPLILDNLGISAVELRQKLEGVGHSGATVGDVAKAVGQIATESLKEMGDVTETTAIKWERLNAEVTNAKVEVGNYANVLMSDVLPVVTRFVRGLDMISTDLQFGFGTWKSMEQMTEFMDTWAGDLEKVKRQMLDIDRVDVFGDKSSEDLRIEAINEQLDIYLNKINGTKGMTRAYWQYMYDGVNKLLEGLDDLTDGENGSFNALNAELKLAKENWAKATAVDDIIEQRLEIIRLEEEIKKLQALGVPLPKVKKALPWVDPITEADLPSMDGLFDGGETWIENLRRRREEGEKFIEHLRSMGDEMGDVGAETGKLGKSIGIMLVNSFDQLGKSIGEAMSGAEGSIQSLAQMILQNIGNILIMAGMSTTPMGIPLIVAGAALQLGQGIWSGLGSNANVPGSGNSPSGGNVYFEISGNNLAGVLSRHNARNTLVT